MLKNNVPAPSCIPPAGLEVLTRRHVNDALSELHPRSGLQVLKGHQQHAASNSYLRKRFVITGLAVVGVRPIQAGAWAN
jgi:hypothetical protein